MALLESAFSEIKLPRDLYDKLVAQLKADFATAEGVADGSVFEGRGVATLEGYPTFDVKIPGALLHLAAGAVLREEGGPLLPADRGQRLRGGCGGGRSAVEHGAAGTGGDARVRDGVPVREGVVRVGESVSVWRWLPCACMTDR